MSSNPTIENNDDNSAVNGRASKRHKSTTLEIYDVNYLLTEGVFDFESFENKQILEMMEKW